jgi:murein L,D-transpeptidase YafK
LIAVIALALWQNRSFFLTPVPSPTLDWQAMNAAQRLDDVHRRRANEISTELARQGLSLGDEVFIRIIKENNELTLWMRPHDEARFRVYKSWPIARWSGTLGPKQQEGDGQAPEGFYDVTASRMNPMSKYHLSFNIGYPNAYDLAHQRTGSLIMVHGSDVSIGCFAMTDPVIEEIYLIVEAALKKGQSSIAVHCFPFRMTDERLAAEAHSEWHEFWMNLKEGWDAFEKTSIPPA